VARLAGLVHQFTRGASVLALSRPSYGALSYSVAGKPTGALPKRVPILTHRFLDP
jgi:hypothetical protein